MKRLIQRNILNPLATMLLDGSAKDGDIIKVDVKHHLLSLPQSKDEEEEYEFEPRLSLTPIKNILSEGAE